MFTVLIKFTLFIIKQHQTKNTAQFTPKASHKQFCPHFPKTSLYKMLTKFSERVISKSWLIYVDYTLVQIRKQFQRLDSVFILSYVSFVQKNFANQTDSIPLNFLRKTPSKPDVFSNLKTAGVQWSSRLFWFESVNKTM